MAKVKGVLPGLEIGDKIQIGGAIYAFTAIKDINSSPKIVFTLVKLCPVKDIKKRGTGRGRHR